MTLQNYALVRSIARGLDVLQLINSRAPMTTMDIAKELGLPYPTTHRVIQTLIHEGYVEREPDRKRYRPTILVRSLSNGHRFENEMATIAKTSMTDFTQKNFWPVSILSRVGARMVVLESTHSDTTSTFINYYPGDSVPFYESASAKVWLAHCPGLYQEMMLAPSYPGNKYSKTWTSDAAFTKTMIDDVRHKGYAIHGRYETNCWDFRTTSISVPIFKNTVFATALTLTYFSKSMSQDRAILEFLEPLKQCADRISVALSTSPFPSL